MPPVSFASTSPVALTFDKKSRRCVGFGCFSMKDGVEYVDLHGDHFSDDELFKAVGGLMKQPFDTREINVEHLGAAQGSIVTAFALTEDIAKAMTPPIDTGGNYGVLVDFEPSADLLKRIEAGEMLCLSMEGKAHDVEVVKSAEGADIAATKRKRNMRGVELTKWAVCKAGAHEGAGIAIVKAGPQADVIEALKKSGVRAFAEIHVGKTLAGAKKKLKAAIARHERHMDGTEATDDDSQQKLMDEMRDALAELGDESGMSMDKARVAKRAPAMTSAHDGHQHLIGDVDEKDGFTSWETAASDKYGHSHPWVRIDNRIVIGEANGHSHEIEETTMPTDIEKAQADITALKADLAKSNARVSTLGTALAIACSLPPEQLAYVSRLDAAGQESFLAKSATERAELAKPVYVSKSTGDAFYASDDRRLVEMAKAADAGAVELAKAREAAEVATFEKRAAAELPSLRGTVAEKAALLKAVEGIADEAVRKVALEMLKSADHATASVLKPVGFAGAAPVVGSALEAYDKGLEAFAKAKDPAANPDKYADEFLGTSEGSRLYKAYEAETAAQRRVAH